MNITDKCPKLEIGEVHIWSGSLAVEQDQMPDYVKLLSVDELARANRFKFERHRQRFVVARAKLRQLLGCYLSCEPKQVSFAYSDKGKPYIKSPITKADIRFNLSHSQNTVLYGFVRGRDIGVDIEKNRTDMSYLEIAQRYFSKSEYELLRRLSEPEGAQAFFRCWARKEAFIKAVGEGLSFPLAQIDVGVEPHKGLFVPHVLHEDFAGAPWRVCDLAIADSFAASLAVYGEVPQLLYLSC